MVLVRKTLVFVDPADVIMAVGTPKSDDPQREEAFEILTEVIRTQRANMNVSDADLDRNRRGDYPAAVTGISFGGGQPVGGFASL